MKRTLTDLDALAIKAKTEKDCVLKLKEAVRGYTHRMVNKYIAAFGNNCCGVERCDLEQSAFVALLNAIKYYNDDAGAGFLTPYTFSLKTAFADCYGIRTSKRDALLNAVSADTPIDEDGEITVLDTIPSKDTMQSVEDSIYQEQLHECLEKALSKIEPELADTLRKIYFDGQTSAKLAKDRKCDESCINSLKAKAFRQMRNPIYPPLREFSDFNPYLSTGFQAFCNSGLSVEERCLLTKESNDEFNRRSYGKEKTQKNAE